MYPRILSIRTLQHGEVPLVCKFLLVVSRTISMGTNVEQIRSLRESLRLEDDIRFHVFEASLSIGLSRYPTLMVMVPRLVVAVAVAYN